MLVFYAFNGLKCPTPFPFISILPVPFLMCAVFVLGVKSLRARAVKRIAGIVDADASIMSREAVRQSVTSSFLDEAVSVRQVRDGLLIRTTIATLFGFRWGVLIASSYW